MMKAFLFFSSIFVLTFFYACDNSVDNNDELIVINSKGTIVTDSLRMRGFFLKKSDQNYLGTTILFPSNLPDSFKYEGNRILFGGKLIKCPPNALCAAQEIILSSIRKL